MKTLDEVIKKFELCNSYSYDMCNSSCPYFDDKCACDPDALHYLKEYRKRLIQDLDELRQKKYELEINMKLDALLQEKPWEKRK